MDAVVVGVDCDMGGGDEVRGGGYVCVYVYGDAVYTVVDDGVDVRVIDVDVTVGAYGVVDVAAGVVVCLLLIFGWLWMSMLRRLTMRIVIRMVIRTLLLMLILLSMYGEGEGMGMGGEVAEYDDDRGCGCGSRWGRYCWW